MFYYITERINLIYNLFSTLKLKLHLYSTFNKTLLVLMALNFTINYANALQVILNMLIDSLTFKCSFFPLHLVYNSSRFKKKSSLKSSIHVLQCFCSGTPFPVQLIGTTATTIDIDC